MRLRHLKRWSQIVLPCCSDRVFGSPLFESHEPLRAAVNDAGIRPVEPDGRIDFESDCVV